VKRKLVQPAGAQRLWVNPELPVSSLKES